MKKLIPVALLGMCVAMPALANEKDGMDHKSRADYYFTKIDTNNDGKVSKAEHDAFSAKKFDEADSNNDNMISRDEMMAFKQKEKGEMSPSAGGEQRPPVEERDTTGSNKNKPM